MKSYQKPQKSNEKNSTESKDNNFSASNFFYNEIDKTINGTPIWKLFIDKSCHKFNTELYFDHHKINGTPIGEPGYCKAMQTAFQYMFSTLGKRLDAEEFKILHHLCVKSVERVNSTAKEFSAASYGFDMNKASQEAKKEWESDQLILLSTDARFYEHELNSDKYLAWLLVYPEFLRQVYSYYSCQSTAPDIVSKALEEITLKTNALFEDYYTQISLAKSEDDKLEAIVSLCRKLEIGHFFADGNQRTIVFVLLNKLLIENGFSPTILEDPVCFDGYLSKKELVQAVKLGQKYFLECSKYSTKNIAAAKPTLFSRQTEGLNTSGENIPDDKEQPSSSPSFKKNQRE